MKIKYCENGIDAIIDVDTKEEANELYEYLLAMEEFQNEIWNDPEMEEPSFPDALKELENEELWYQGVYREIYYPENPEQLKTFIFIYENEGYNVGYHWSASTRENAYDKYMKEGELYD